MSARTRVQTLRELVLRADRAGTDLPTAAEKWRALAAAQWSLVDHFEHDGRRYFLARAPGPSRGCSARERMVLTQAAHGLTNKEIAYALHVSVSTVSSHLSNAMRRLGLRDRWILAVLLGAASDELARALDLRAASIAVQGEQLVALSHRIVEPDWRAAAQLTDAEHEVARMAARGYSNARIAEVRRTSVHTIANQMRAILRKLEVPSRRELSVRLTRDAAALACA